MGGRGAQGLGHGRQAGRADFAETFALADADGPGATGALVGVAKDEGQSAIARASAFDRLNAAAVTRGADGPRRNCRRATNPKIRAAAIRFSPRADAGDEKRRADPAVARSETRAGADAGRPLAGGRGQEKPAPPDLAPFEQALNEYVAGQISPPSGQIARQPVRSIWREAARRRTGRIRKAMAIDRTFTPAPIALAEIARARQRRSGGRGDAAKGAGRQPEIGPAHPRPGLGLIGQKRVPDGLVQAGGGGAAFARRRALCLCLRRRAA